jgi:tRNA threonylcarbamoyladenosine biosynthesis protein TsaE
MEFISESEIETKNIAKNIASKLKKGDIIILEGELGAGKTKFTEGILEYFNLQDEISSPTFTIVNEYVSNEINIFHFDLYRLSDIDEFYAIGGEEYFNKGICLIEWGEQIEEILPNNYRKIIFTRDLENENTRVLNFENFDDILNDF